MVKKAEFLAKAAEMRRVAGGMSDAAVKAEYLKLAEAWEDLARNRRVAGPPRASGER